MAYFKEGSQVTKTEYHYGFKFQHRYEVQDDESILIRVFSAHHELVFERVMPANQTSEEMFEDMNNTVLNWLDDNTNATDALMIDLLQGSNKPYDFKIKARY